MSVTIGSDLIEGECVAVAAADLAMAFAAERGRLVGLCARLSGSVEAAEDLAQETLAEAWRNRHKLHDPSGAGRWLSAIARHVCARWARERGHDLSRFAVSPDTAGEGIPADGPDLEVELERDELAHLLDRAMAYLPVETRVALIERYVEGAPQAQVAVQLGLSEGAVAMRLQRGKLALRRLLANELRDEAAAYGLGGDDEWEDARLWCPLCGKHRLRATGDLTVRCPGCTPVPGEYVSQTTMPLLHRDTRSASGAYTRLLDWMHRFYYPIAPGGTVPCHKCLHPLLPVVTEIGWSFAPQARYTITSVCGRCGDRMERRVSGLTLTLPEGRRFWREERRVRLLSDRAVEVDGQAAVVLGLESMTSSARFEVVADLRTLAVLNMHGERGQHR
jgi:RNA polymerase sigma factor (sigma-70 family)